MSKPRFQDHRRGVRVPAGYIPQNRAERRKLKRGSVLHGEPALQALMWHIDRLQADPRPWRIHGEGEGQTS